jgi:O-acetyl-ADP-ribose deacetylase (regulator of RNase III)
MAVRINHTFIELIEGDITTLDADAIVNAANEQLSHGAGLAALISRRGGPTIQKESHLWVHEHGRVVTGSAAITSAGTLNARHVIHAVGPVYDQPSSSSEFLASAVRSALRMADDHELKSIAVPAISTGIFGYPLEAAARVMLEATFAYLRGETELERVVYCLFGQHAFDVFAREFAALV